MRGENGRPRDRRHMAIAARAVGDVDRIDQAFEFFGAREQRLRVGRIRRRHFDGDDEIARPAGALERPQLSLGHDALADRRLERRIAAAMHDLDPGRGAALAHIDGRQQRRRMRAMIGRDALGAFGGLDPDAAHLGLDLAIPARAHTAARAVAHFLGAIHRAGHAGGGQHALPAFAAIEHQALEIALDRMQHGRGRPLAEQPHHGRKPGR